MFSLSQWGKKLHILAVAGCAHEKKKEWNSQMTAHPQKGAVKMWIPFPPHSPRMRPIEARLLGNGFLAPFSFRQRAADHLDAVRNRRFLFSAWEGGGEGRGGEGSRAGRPHDSMRRDITGIKRAGKPRQLSVHSADRRSGCPRLLQAESPKAVSIQPTHPSKGGL